MAGASRIRRWSAAAEGARIQEPLVLRGATPAFVEERVAVLVPLAVGEIVAEHRRRGLRLRHDAERQVGLDQALQRLLDVTRVAGTSCTTALKRLTAARYSRRSR